MPSNGYCTTNFGLAPAASFASALNEGSFGPGAWVLLVVGRVIVFGRVVCGGREGLDASPGAGTRHGVGWFLEKEEMS